MKLLYVFFYLKMAGPPSAQPKRFRLQKHHGIVIRSLRAIPFEKVVVGVSDAPKKMLRGGLGMVPILLRGGLQKRQISLRGGIATGPLYYGRVVNFFHPPKFYRITPSIFM